MWDKSRVRMSRLLDTSSTTQNGRNRLLGWEKCTKLRMSVCSSKTRIILLGVRGWHQNDWKAAEYGSHVEELDEICWSCRTYFVFWSHRLGMYSTWMQTEWNYYWRMYKRSLSHFSAATTEKIAGVWKTSQKSRSMVPRHGRTCSKMRWEIPRAANNKVEQLYKVSSLCLDHHPFKQEELESVGELSQVCSQNVVKCMYLTHLQEQSQNGFKLATDDWQDWFHTFITQMTTDNSVTWVTRRSIVDWVHSKTQILLATLRTRSQPRGESYVFLEVKHLFQ